MEVGSDRESGLSQNRVVTSLPKANDEFIGSRPYGSFGRDKQAVQLLGAGLLVAAAAAYQSHR